MNRLKPPAQMNRAEKIAAWEAYCADLERRFEAGRITPDEYDRLLRNFEERINLNWVGEGA